MISKIQPFGMKTSFKSDTNTNSPELIDYKKSFLTEHLEKQYQNDLKRNQKESMSWIVGGFVISLLKYLDGEKNGAAFWAVAGLGACIINNLFCNPKKEAYNKELQKEFDKIDNPKA